MTGAAARAMAKSARPSPAPRRRRAIRTDEFQQWWQTLDAERQAKVDGAIRRVVAGGPTLKRPHVDVIHGSSLHKLKEARVDRGIRVLFAFDSNGNAAILVGGDKTGKWNRWYSPNIPLAERLYAKHERSIGKEPHCLSRREAGRKSPQRSR